MTLFPPLVNGPMIVIGGVGLIVLAVYSGLRRKNREPGFWMSSGAIILVLFLGWLILTSYFRFLFYEGGSIDDIYFRDAIADVCAYAVTVGILLLIERRRK